MTKDFKNENMGQKKRDDEKEKPQSKRKRSRAKSIEKTSSETSSVARRRWEAVRKMIIQASRREDDFSRHEEGLINELKKRKQRSNVKESVLSILKSQASLTEKVFERQKYSAKEILIRKRGGLDTSGHKRGGDAQESIAEYNRQAELNYKITPQIQRKLDKLKKRNDATEEKIRKTEDEDGLGFFSKLLGASIIGQTLMANPRFYKMDPHEHLPELCRRCRRPLIDTLESRFTSIGILFCIFLPIIGIFLLYANREFVCVICEEIYVYGDLTARRDEDYDEDFGEEGRKK